MIGDGSKIVNKYENVIIFDDMGSEIWSSVVPQDMSLRNMNVFGVQPQPFVCGKRGSIMFDKGESHYNAKNRNDAYTFLDDSTVSFYRFRVKL